MRRKQEKQVRLTYRALVAMTVRLLSWIIFFICWTHRRYRNMYPTETTLPFFTSESETSCAPWISPVPTG